MLQHFPSLSYLIVRDEDPRHKACQALLSTGILYQLMETFITLVSFVIIKFY